jgi:AcrR family transcriptional regulator
MPRVADPGLRSRLLAAATVEFAESGYAGASLDGIAARAGVTKGAVYFLFAGKEELFFAVLDHCRERRRERLPTTALDVVDGHGGAVALRVFLAAYLDLHFADPALARVQRVLATELRGRFTARLREDDRQELRWLRASLRDLLVAGARDGTLAAGDPALTAFLLAAAVAGILEQWQAASADVETHCQGEHLARAMVAPLVTGRQPGSSELFAEGPFHPPPA